MKPRRTYIPKIALSIVVLAACAAALAVQLPASAATSASQSANCTTTGGQPGVHTSIAFTDQRDANGQPCLPISSGSGLQSGIVFVVLRVILVFVGGGIGLATVGGLVYGGFLYMTARADASQAKKGETVIRDAVIGLLVFFGMAAILNFLIPGGLLQ